MWDSVDLIVDQHRTTHPEQDFSTFAVFARMFRTVNLLDRDAKEAHRRRGLDPGEVDALMGLMRLGPPYRQSAGALLRTMLISGGTLTSRVDRLVAKGLVTREVDPDNRRSVLIELTGEGLRRAERVLDEHLAWCRERFGGLSPDEQEQLASVLRTLLISLGDGIEERAAVGAHPPAMEGSA